MMRKVFVWSTLLLFLVASVFVLTNDSIGGLKKKGDKGQRLAKTNTITRPLWTPNRIANYITNNGQLVSNIPTGSAGMEWPAGSHNTINYASGIWVAGQKSGEIVVAYGEYTVEFQPGPILPSGLAADSRDPRYRVYIINQADLADPLRNPDYVEWPYDDGAPFLLNPDGSRQPGLIGNSTTWCVFNDLDETLHARGLATKPVGIEVQQTAWAFNRPDAFGDMMFFKFQIINKGGVDVTDAYVSFWADVDIGDALDLVGCDTTLSIGFNYKTQADGLYGPVAPAIAYDFFQGPIVASPGDTASVSGRKVPGFRNLPMSSFAKYINGGPANLQDPETGPEAYNFMQGLDRVGAPIVNPQTNQVTKFWHPGDPATATGWLDDVHNDKRFLMSTGPFTLAAGDTQEVVGGMLIAQGPNAAETVRLLKLNDALAQLAYDNNFALPPSPPSPVVSTYPDTASIVLRWDNLAESYEATDRIDLDTTGAPTKYTFQGYNVYQLNEAQVGANTSIKKIATYDIIDGVTKIKDDVFLQSIGQTANIVVQDGSDSGLRRFFRATVDYLNGNSPLIPNRQYYFAITAYGYNEIGIPRTLESPIAGKVITAIPQSPPLGNRLTTPAGDTLTVNHTSSGILSDGKAYPIVVDPSSLTGHDYKITLRDDPDGGFLWDVTDVTANQVKISGWKNQGDLGAGDFPYLDGMLIQLFGPPEAINSWTFTPSADRWFTGVNWGGPDLFFGGMDIGKNFFDSNITPDQYVTVEIRFLSTQTGQRAYSYVRGGTPSYGFVYYERQYFTAWDVTSQPERQINVAIAEQAGPTADGIWAPSTSNAHRNYLFILRSSYSGDTPDPYYTSRNALSQAGEFDTMYSLWPLLRGSRTAPEWADGQVFRITPNFVNTKNDVFAFKSNAPIRNDAALAKEQAAKLVNVYPNPYAGFNISERDPVNRFVTFTHLTPTAKIRIFTIVGELVRVINHTDGTQFERWDLRNSDDIPVASGIYIAHVELPGVGQKILKLAVMQPEERLDVF